MLGVTSIIGYTQGYIQFKMQQIKKKNRMIDLEEEEKGDNRFRRFEYWGIGPFFMLHYVGDHSVFKPFTHRSPSKQTKPYILSAPIVKEEVN